MVEVYNRNIVSNFKYTIKAVTIFMSIIVLKHLNVHHKLLFRKLEKDLKYYTKLNADIQFNSIAEEMKYRNYTSKKQFGRFPHSPRPTPSFCHFLELKYHRIHKHSNTYDAFNFHRKLIFFK